MINKIEEKVEGRCFLQNFFIILEKLGSLENESTRKKGVEDKTVQST